jgi:hypothetical protein
MASPVVAMRYLFAALSTKPPPKLSSPAIPNFFTPEQPPQLPRQDRPPACKPERKSTADAIVALIFQKSNIVVIATQALRRRRVRTAREDLGTARLFR